MKRAKSTLKKYEMCLSKLDKLGIKYENNDNMSEMIKNIKDMKRNDGEGICNNSVNTYLSAVLWFYEKNGYKMNNECEKTVKDEIKEIKNEKIEKYSDNKLSKKEKGVYLDWDEIVKCYDSLYREREKNMTAMKRCVTIGLYVLFPPRRVMDYSKMVVRVNTDDLDENENYYIMNPPLFIFNVFKTKDTCEKIFDVPNDLKELLNEYIKKYDLIDKSLLDISENELSIKIKKIMSSVTGKSASANTFRHSYISYMQKSGKINSTSQKKKLASMMGHDHRTQQEVYVKYLEENSSELSDDN
jgi:integrase